MSDYYTIIPYESQYREAFSALNIHWLEKFFVVEPLDRDVLGNPEMHIIEPGGYIWLAQVNNTEIVGTITLIKDGDTFELSKMAVHPDHQGRGIARILLRAAVEKARALGVDSIYLLTSTKLATANSLYERFGFKEVPPTEEDLAHYDRCDTRWEYYFSDK